jgi:hypothetical protein
MCPDECASSTLCVDCLAKKCTDPFLACVADYDAYAVWECRADCSSDDVACRDGCTTGHEKGSAIADALSACDARECAVECGE